MIKYFNGNNWMSLRDFINVLDIMPATPSAHRSRSVARDVGWNDPIHAYLAILKFLKPRLSKSQFNETFFSLKRVYCKYCLALVEGDVSFKN